MAELHVRRGDSDITLLIEDPILANSRLFLSGAAHDTTTLAPLFQKHFCNTYQDRFRKNHVDNMTVGIDQDFIYLPMYVEKGTITCNGNSERGRTDNFITATFHQSLDPVQLPVKKIWKTVTNRVWLLHNEVIPIEGSAGAGRYGNLLYNTDITAGSGATQYWTSINATQASAICYEDINNNRLWGISSGGLNSNVCFISAYDSPAPAWTAVTIPFPTAAQVFFLGADDLGFIHFVECQDNNGEFSWYTFFKVHPNTFAVTTVLSRSNRANSGRVNPKTWPSNVRRASGTRRVLYSSHFDGNASTGALVPIRYVFNPVDGGVVATNCTMIYPQSTTFATYSAMHTTTAVSSTSNECSWHTKGHQFTDQGVNYITYWLTDKNAVAGLGPARWDSILKRTMMTYSIGAGTGDDVLTYHSSYAFPNFAEMPKDFMPINGTGTQIMVPVTGSLRFFGWNSSTGWSITGNYPYDFVMLGLDQTNRILGTSRERGNGVVHFITPTLPVTIAVVMAASSYTFTGGNISTSCTVEAFGTAGTRIVAAVNLAIDGASMLFTANSTKNIVVNTSSSAVVTVQLTITGGGINNIIASVDI